MIESVKNKFVERSGDWNLLRIAWCRLLWRVFARKFACFFKGTLFHKQIDTMLDHPPLFRKKQELSDKKICCEVNVCLLFGRFATFFFLLYVHRAFNSSEEEAIERANRRWDSKVVVIKIVVACGWKIRTFDPLNWGLSPKSPSRYQQMSYQAVGVVENWKKPSSQ